MGCDETPKRVAKMYEISIHAPIVGCDVSMERFIL